MVPNVIVSPSMVPKCLLPKKSASMANCTGIEAPNPIPQNRIKPSRCQLLPILAKISVPTSWNPKAAAITWRLSRASPMKPLPILPTRLTRDTDIRTSAAISRLTPKLVMAGIWWTEAEIIRCPLPVASASCQNARVAIASLAV